MLQFEPQTLSQLRDRYPMAMARIWNQRELMANSHSQNFEAARPGNTRENVFDCIDGWRLIISQEATLAGGLALHLSGSVVGDSRACREIDTLTESVGNDLAFKLYLKARFRDLCQDDAVAGSLQLICVSEVGIPHFKIDLAAPATFVSPAAQNAMEGVDENLATVTETIQ